jgi:hypothetical protein
MRPWPAGSDARRREDFTSGLKLVLCALDLGVRLPREASDLVQELEGRVRLLGLLEPGARGLELREQLLRVSQRIRGAHGVTCSPAALAGFG